MNKRLGAIVIAACLCGLLFSGAAAARQAADSITVTGVVLGTATNGTYVQFSGNGSSFKQISLSGGSNFHFSASYDGGAGSGGWVCSGGPCGVGAPCFTPGNGGVSCDFTPFLGGPAPTFWVNTLISGTPPPAVTGTVVYADGSKGTFTAPLTEGPPAHYSQPNFSVGVKGTSIQIQVRPPVLPPILQFSLDGGSNWHVTAISSTGGGSCSLTPSTGGGSCAFATPAFGFVINATFSGPPPTSLGGRITYAHNVTLPWGARACGCKGMSAAFTSFKKERHGKLVFFLKWQLECGVGWWGACGGAVAIGHPALPPDLQLRQANGKAWHGGMLHILCNHKKGAGCPMILNGEKKLVLIGPAAARARETVSFQLTLRCGPSLSGSRHTEDLTLTFDKHGNLERNKSHLGKLG